MTYDSTPSRLDIAAFRAVNEILEQDIFSDPSSVASRMRQLLVDESPVTMVHQGSEESFGTYAEAPAPDASDPTLELIDDLAAAFAAGAPVTVSDEHAKSIVFIDSGVTEVTSIIRAASTNAEIVLLDQASDGVAQIAAHLAGRTGLESIHIVSHGEAGELRLGNVSLTLETVSGTHASGIAAMRSALAERAVIALVDREAVGSERERSFLIALATATGARIETSRQDAGHDGTGSNWEAEGATGLAGNGAFAGLRGTRMLDARLIGPGAWVPLRFERHLDLAATSSLLLSQSAWFDEEETQRHAMGAMSIARRRR